MNELLKIDDTFDKIEKYYRSSGKLSVKETEICERWELAFSLLLHHRNKKIAVSKFISVLKNKGTEISIPTAYRDFDSAEKLFVPLKKYTKEFLRLILIESALRDVKQAEKMAKESINNPKVWSEIMKTKDKAELRVIKAAGLDVDDPNMPDFSKLQIADININIDDSLKNMLSTMISKGTIDVTELFNNATDATIIDESSNLSDES